MRLFLIPLLAFGWTVASIAQSDLCDELAITQFMLDDQNPDQWLITIAYEGGDNPFIEYPFIDVLLNDDGDTLATGFLFFFGQISGIAQDYPVTVLPGAQISSFTISFVYNLGDDADTCNLAFELPTAVSEWETPQQLMGFPNPVRENLQVVVAQEWKSARYVCLNACGQCIATGTLDNVTNADPSQDRTGAENQVRMALDTRQWPNGIYTVVLPGTPYAPMRIVKQDTP